MNCMLQVQGHIFIYNFNELNVSINKAYRPNAHLLYIVMHYNGNIMVIMAFTLFTFTFTLLF